MRIITAIAEMQAVAREFRSSGTLGLVPTMGALHSGHLSLIDAAKRDCAHVVASIFVNPLQFGPNEDFSRYPRTFDADCAALTSAGIDVLFAPSAETLTPAGATTFVEVAGISDRLDGASRPATFAEWPPSSPSSSISSRPTVPTSARRMPRSLPSCAPWCAISIFPWRLSPAR